MVYGRNLFQGGHRLRKTENSTFILFGEGSVVSEVEDHSTVQHNLQELSYYASLLCIVGLVYKPDLCVVLASAIYRVGPNRMTEYTPYPRYAVYSVPYLRFLCKRKTDGMLLHKRTCVSLGNTSLTWIFARVPPLFDAEGDRLQSNGCTCVNHRVQALPG
jgi:hypothetical protein